MSLARFYFGTLLYPRRGLRAGAGFRFGTLVRFFIFYVSLRVLVVLLELFSAQEVARGSKRTSLNERMNDQVVR